MIFNSNIHFYIGFVLGQNTGIKACIWKLVFVSLMWTHKLEKYRNLNGIFKKITRWRDFVSFLLGVWCCAGDWEKAHGLLKNNSALTDLSDELEAHGKRLEDAGRVKDAEKLYLTLDKPDLAINMYKNFQRYDEVRAKPRNENARNFHSVINVYIYNCKPGGKKNNKLLLLS